MEGITVLPDELNEILEGDYEDLNITFSNDFPSNSIYTGDHALVCAVHPSPVSLNIFICIFYLLIFLLAIPGNLVVCFVVGSSRYKLSPSDLFLFHLALADLILALTLPFWAVYILQGWLFADVTCKLVSMALEANVYISILFLVCISADRYMVVVHASMEDMDGQRRREICSWISCGSVWTVGLMLSVPAAIYNKSYHLRTGNGKMQCGEHFDTSSADMWRLATRILRHILGFVIPLGAMLAFYGITIARLVRTRGFRKQRAIKVITAVVVAFLICWCPNHIAVMVDTLVRAKSDSDCQRRHETDLVLLVTQCLGMLHCCINPLLYAFVGERFRSNLRRLIHKRGALQSTSRLSRLSSTTSQDVNTALV